MAEITAVTVVIKMRKLTILMIAVILLISIAPRGYAGNSSGSNSVQYSISYSVSGGASVAPTSETVTVAPGSSIQTNPTVLCPGMQRWQGTVTATITSSDGTSISVQSDPILCFGCGDQVIDQGEDCDLGFAQNGQAGADGCPGCTQNCKVPTMDIPDVCAAPSPGMTVTPLSCSHYQLVAGSSPKCVCEQCVDCHSDEPTACNAYV